MTAIIVISNLPDRETAERVARQLVEERLAACINVLAPCMSIYHWQGDLETAQEVPLLIKSTAALYPRLEARLTELHPYELPEILAVPVLAGLPGYLAWVQAETQPT